MDGRKKRMAKRVCETIVTGLSLACFVVIFILDLCFPVVYKQTSSKEGGVWRKVFQRKLLSHLSHNVCRLLFSPVLLHNFTNYLSDRCYHYKKIMHKQCKKKKKWISAILITTTTSVM